MSQESKWVKWDFLLGLACPSGSPALVTLTDRGTGAQLVAEIGAGFDRIGIARLLQQAQTADSPSASIRELGRILSEIAFPRKVAALLRECALAGPIRLGLRLDTAELSEAPWECAHCPFEPDVAIGLHPTMYVHRVLETRSRPRNPRALTKVLLASADPQSKNYPALASADRELHSVSQALSAAECRGVQAIVLKYATPASLARSLSETSPDVVHFICHGDVRASGGALILESDKPHRETALYADELAKLILSSGARLVILSGCFTSAGLASTGGTLVMAGVPAVVGMQAAISDSGAMLFSRALYASLAEGAPLEPALAQARTAISGSGLDWTAPILMTGGGESLAFELAGRTSSAAPAGPRHNVPLEERRFIGRSAERAKLSKLVLSSGSRFITVTGMGGMGKTSLAKRVALDLADEFADGVRFVECEALEDEQELLAGLAGSLGLEGARVSEKDLLASLRGKSQLLVFDCFERIAPYAEVLPRLLQAEPGLRMLVTSRVVLGVQFEQEFALSQMPIKKGRAQAAEGIELFEETAACVDSTFKVTRRNRKLVETLLVDLEGVPLAIVLAAGRLRHMSLEELQVRVRTQRLDVLKRTPRARDDKHSDLLRVVGDSMALLLEEDRVLVKALSVFQGGFFQDDACAVLGESREMLDGISLLRDHSFLMSQVVSARMRFRILDTIREFLDRIPDDESVSATRERHSRHFALLAGKIRLAFDDGRYGPARELLSLDIGNYRSGIKWAVKNGDPDLIRVYAHSLARVYFETGAQQEFELLSSAAESIAGEQDALLVMEIYGLQGESFRRNNRPRDAIEVWQRKAALCRKTGDLRGCADTVLEIARLAMRIHDEELAASALDEFSSLRGQFQDLALVATGIALQARAHLDHSRTAEAVSLCRELEELLVNVPCDSEGLYAWSSLSKIYRAAARLEDAARVAYRCLDNSLENGFLMAAGLTLLELSRIQEGLGNTQAAARQIAIAGLIPAKPWPAMTEQVSQRRLEFERSPQGVLLAEAEAAIGKADWEALARAEVPEDLRPANV